MLPQLTQLDSACESSELYRGISTHVIPSVHNRACMSGGLGGGGGGGGGGGVVCYFIWAVGMLPPDLGL